jgi:hypothetical protein
VRLRIRLARGSAWWTWWDRAAWTKAQAERVREAERSIDLDLSEAGHRLRPRRRRGRDQVLIPSFQAGTPTRSSSTSWRPARRVADVSVRYKDLLAAKRRDSGEPALSRGVSAPGPLERNVLANLLAFRVSRALACAGDALAAGTSGASAPIRQARALLAGLGALVPGLAGDPALVRDAAMLSEYAGLLASGVLGPSERPRVADSLRYAARLKLLPRPAPLAVAAL